MENYSRAKRAGRPVDLKEPVFVWFTNTIQLFASVADGPPPKRFDAGSTVAVSRQPDSQTEPDMVPLGAILMQENQVRLEDRLELLDTR